MYVYRQVERALMQLHNLDEASHGAFRGRIQHLQRLGLVPSSPGKGKRIEYDFEDAARWAFALQLQEFGIDPITVKAIIDRCWTDAFPAIEPYGSLTPKLFLADPARISYAVWNGDFFYRVLEASEYQPVSEMIVRILIINLTHIGQELARALDWASGREVGAIIG